MKNFFFKIAPSSRFMLAAFGIGLAIGVVACKTTVVSQKTDSIASQTAATNQPTKPSYYTCGMHPSVRSLDSDGKCPICQMPLLPAENVLVVDPVSGKTVSAATYPAISGYYSCVMHPTVLSKEADGKCPECGMPLLPVENPVFIQPK